MNEANMSKAKMDKQDKLFLMMHIIVLISSISVYFSVKTTMTQVALMRQSK